MAKKHSKTRGSTQNTGELRIIGGKWRSRKLTFVATKGLRPSPARIRETLFNWLSGDLQNAHCLDLFAGSGALGFEALSRGVKSLTMVELNPDVVVQLKNNQRLLDATNLTILNQDANELSKISSSHTEQGFDIIFCDPPFNQDFVQPIIKALTDSPLLTNHALLYVETEKSLINLDLPEAWQVLKNKVAGDVRYRLMQFSRP